MNSSIASSVDRFDSTATIAFVSDEIRRSGLRQQPDGLRLELNRTPIVGLKKFRFDDRRCGSFICARIEGNTMTTGSGARHWCM